MYMLYMQELMFKDVQTSVYPKKNVILWVLGETGVRIPLSPPNFTIPNIAGSWCIGVARPAALPEKSSAYR
jgi:hypothetical protein